MEQVKFNVQFLVVCSLMILGLVKHGNCFSSGAPVAQCVAMMPSHGVAAQTGASPYAITLPAGVTTYTPGVPITVGVTGTFRGILLQARDVTGGNTTPRGVFSNQPSGTQLRQCTSAGDAVTHSSGADKTTFSVTWTPPSTNLGMIRFVATIVQTQPVFWTMQQSASLSYAAPMTNPPATMAPNQPTQASNTQSSATPDDEEDGSTSSTPMSASSTPTMPGGQNGSNGSTSINHQTCWYTRSLIVIVGLLSALFTFRRI